MSLSLILARVVLTVGQLYVGQKRSTRKMVADSTLVDGSSLKKKQPFFNVHLFMQQWILSVTFWDLWLMQLLGVHFDIREELEGRKHKQPTFCNPTCVKTRFHCSHVVYLKCVSDRVEFSSIYGNTKHSVGAVCGCASTEWFGHRRYVWTQRHQENFWKESIMY